MKDFSSDEKDNSAASGKLRPSPPPSPSPMRPLTPPLLPTWFGDASASSGGSDVGDELSSDTEGSSTGSCESSTRLVGATFGDGGDSMGHSQKHTLFDAGLLPSACGSGSSPLPAESSSSSNDGPALPLSLRKYAKKWACARAAVDTVVAPPPAPRIPELDIESAAAAAVAVAAAGEDRALPWISTAVAAARNMTRTTTAIPGTIATAAAARFRSHWR